MFCVFFLGSFLELGDSKILSGLETSGAQTFCGYLGQAGSLLARNTEMCCIGRMLINLCKVIAVPFPELCKILKNKAELD